MKSKVLSALRSLAAAGILIGCSAALWPRFWAAVPLENSVLPRYAGCLLALLGFTAATLGFGLRVTNWLLPGPRRDGHATVSFATGVFLFGIAMAGAGHLHLYSAPLFYFLPALFLVLGTGALYDEIVRASRALRQPVSYSWFELGLVVLGLLAAGLAIFPTLTPENVNYDARWYHLGIAEQYALLGGIEPSAEGNHLVTSPHLVSWIYTWAFLETPGQLFDRVLLANQLEVLCFLATLALVPAAARLLRPHGEEHGFRLSWLAMFLFPAIYIYDTGLMAGADHFAAFWATAAFVVWFWVRSEGTWKAWALLGALLAATMLCKYTSIIFLGPFGLVIAVDTIYRGWKRGQLAQAFQRLGVVAAVGIVLAAPYWLRNLVFYGNPTYPLLHGLFGGHPWTGQSAAWIARYSRELFVPANGSLSWRLAETGMAIINHHYELYTWGDMTAGAPVFGSVFACMALLLPFAGRVGRIWLIAGISVLGIALWFNLAHQMRYLLIFVPLMAASIAVLARQVWGWGLFARQGLVAIIGLQIVGSAELPYFATHRMNGRRAPVAKTFDFLQRGHAERSPARFAVFSDWADLGARLPPKASLLVHNWGPVLGLNRRALTDVPGIQDGLSFSELGTLPRIHARLRELGVTHVGIINPSTQPDSLLGELLIRAFAARLTENRIVHGAWTISELGVEPPADPGPFVMLLGCNDSWPAGLYPRESIADPVLPMHEVPVKHQAPEPPTVENLARADAAIVLGNCPAGLDLVGFQHIGTNNSDQYYLRPPRAP